jgi:hypothetical protein
MAGKELLPEKMKLRRRFAVSSGLSTRLRIKKYSISLTAISNSIIKGGSAFETICFV